MPEATKWITAAKLKTGDVIVIRIDPEILMPVLGVEILPSGQVSVANERHGVTLAEQSTKIRIQC